MFEIIIIGMVLFGGLILLPVLYEVALCRLFDCASADRDSRQIHRAQTPAWHPVTKALAPATAV